jgi:hypothetical protein
MKQTKLVLLIIINGLIIVNLFAQKNKGVQIKFGNLSKAEMIMTAYDKDPEASAVVLFDKGYFDLDMTDRSDFEGTFKQHTRIKIFKKEGYDKANIVIPYFVDVIILDLQASCHNLENGQWVETKLDPEAIVTEKLSKKTYVKKFTIPKVREGSIIEYSITMFDATIGHLPFSWSFQSDIPTIWSEYRANTPHHYKMLPTFQGLRHQPLAVREDTLIYRRLLFGLDEYIWENRVLRWAQKDLPALKTEPMMSSVYNYESRVILQWLGFYKSKSEKEREKMPFKDLVQDVWKQWGEILLDEDGFGDLLKHKGTESLVQSLTEQAATDKDKVLAIYKHIGTTFEVSFRNQLVSAQPFNELLKKRKGAPTELNLLAINMLRKAGITAYPVLISTRSHGILNPDFLPMEERTNRVIAYLPTLDPNEPFLLDVTGFPNPLGLLPFEDLNGLGLMIQDKKTVSWLPLKNKINTKKVFFNTLTLNEKGELSGAIALTATGYDASAARTEIQKEGPEKYANTLLKDLLLEGKLESIKFENTQKLDEKYLQGAFAVKTSSFVTKTDSQMYVSPLLFWAAKENLFKDPERKFDVDFGYPRENGYILNLTIPNGYKVESLPKNTKLNLDNNHFTFTYVAESVGNVVKINVKWSIKKTIFVVEEYPSLRSAYEAILNKMAEQIVLSKI